GAHRDPAAAAHSLGQALRKHLRELSRLGPDQLVEQRYTKFRAMGVFSGR
ncbi:MAG: acetyl-CoA carboxylase carboxyl transferase subunit alpha, partial [Myxococcaceae bacterium]|nr:acetyl-CoA carboxylase carboxyl transferase subunit alpha [Myxococcaceae bacterium]